MNLWVRWKKAVKSVLTLHPQDEDDAEDIGGKTGDNYAGDNYAMP